MADHDSGSKRPESARLGAYRPDAPTFETAARERRRLGGVSRDLAARLVAGGEP